mgnify:CR=1 FL=1
MRLYKHHLKTEKLMKYKLILFATTLVTQVHANDNQIQGVNYLTVGADNACDYSLIQNAVDNSIGKSIRVASNKVYNENVVINNRHASIKGGFANCTDAGNNITDLSRPIIDGGGTGAVITVSNTDLELNVTLNNLYLGNGDAGILTTADSIMSLSNVAILNNNSTGFFAIGGSQEITMTDVIVNSNQGSGILCSGADISLTIEGESVISDNTSINTAGGVGVSNSCFLSMKAPTVVKSNEANSNGGGISVSSGASVELLGVEISQNKANADNDQEGDGGGLYAQGLNTTVYAINARFLNNQGYVGGAVMVENGANFSALNYEDTEVAPCKKPGKCSQFVGNNANRKGGAVAVVAANAFIGNSWIAHNNANFYPAVMAEKNGKVEIEGSYIVRNGDGENDVRLMGVLNIINEFPDTEMKLRNVTIANNNTPGGAISNSRGKMTVLSSIVIHDEVYSEY